MDNLSLAIQRVKLSNEIDKITSMRRGSLNEFYYEQTLKNGTKAKRGPYYNITTKNEAGKTITKAVPKADVEKVRIEVNNYNKFRALTEEYVQVCEQISLVINDEYTKAMLNLEAEFSLELSHAYNSLTTKSQKGEVISMTQMEVAFREAALSEGAKALSRFISEQPENAPKCLKCGQIMSKRDRRSKTIITLLGSLEYSRNYYGCKCGERAIPKDERLGVLGTKFTAAVRRVIAKIAASDSFVDTSSNLKILCGINVSAKDCERVAEEIGSLIIDDSNSGIGDIEKLSNEQQAIMDIDTMYIEYDGTGIPMRKKELQSTKGKHPDGAKTREMKTGCIFTQTTCDEEGNPIREPNSTTYFAQISNAETFGLLLYYKALERGVRQAKRVVVIGDGAKWIWTLAEKYFPSAIHIVDIYHAKEHIAELLKVFYADKGIFYAKKTQLFELLDGGEIDNLIAQFALLEADTEEKQEKVRLETNYFETNKSRMKYNQFRKQGLFVGSGVIEATCKNVVGKRLKQSGMRWSVDGANRMVAVRCEVLSGEFDVIQCADIHDSENVI